MKFFKYLLIWLCIVFLFSSVVGYAYIRVHGKYFFEQQLTKFFGQPAQIEDIRYLVPLGIRFTNLKIKSVLEVEDVRLHLRIPFRLSGHMIIGKLELNRPVFHLVRYGGKTVDFGGVYLRRQEDQFRSQQPERISRLLKGIIIDLLSIEDGEMMLLDLAAAEPVKYHVIEIKSKAMNVVYPLSDQQIRFDAQGIIRGAGDYKFLRQAVFRAEGWVNWMARGMDVALDIHQQEALSAKMTLKGKENHLQILGRIEMDIANAVRIGLFKDVPQDRLGGALLDTVQTSQSHIGLNVDLETQMDAFSLGVVNFEGEWYVPKPKKETPDRFGPGGLFGIIPSMVGPSPKK